MDLTWFMVVGGVVVVFAFLAMMANSLVSIWKNTRDVPAADQKFASKDDVQLLRSDVNIHLSRIELKIQDVSKAREASASGVHHRMNDMATALSEMSGSFKQHVAHTERLLQSVEKVNRLEGEVNGMKEHIRGSHKPN